MDDHYPHILRRYLGEERNSSTESITRATADAARIAAGSQKSSPSAKEPEPISREKRAEYSKKVRPLEEAELLKWAHAHRLWISEKDFTQKYSDKKIGEGAEQKVYLDVSGRTVIKVNSGRFHGNWLEYFNRLLFHAFIFPATAYATIGFTEEDGKFAVITEQAFAKLNKGASREVVETYLQSHGFVRIKNDDYYNQLISVKLEDLHDENVFIDENEGAILFIDPVIYFETVDLKLGGQHIFHFPFMP